MKALGLFAARLLVLALPFICAFPAQSADYSGLPITRIHFKDDLGNPWPDPGRLLPLAVAKQGSPFSRGDIRQGLEYLYLNGRFRDIRVEAFPEDNGVRLEYTLFPVTIVEKVAIEGNHAMSTSRLKDILGRTGGKEYREEKLAELRRDVLSLYEIEGYFDADVEFRAVPADEPRRVVLRAIIAESEPTVIEDIRFAGNAAFPEKDLRSALESRKGRPLRRDLLLDTDRDTLRTKYADAGYPAAKIGPVDMRFVNRRALITVKVEEGPRVVARFSGNREFSDRKLKETLLIWQEQDVSDAAIESSVDRVKVLYRDEGYADAAVEAKKIAGPGFLELDFSIQEGPRLTVEEIRTKGNTVFKEKDLMAGMGLRESGWFRSRPFREDILGKDIEAVRERYVEAGYLDASVEAGVSRSADGKSVSVAVRINEGKRTAVGSISFEGISVFSEAELLAMLGLKPGAPYNEQALEEDKYRILSAYGNRGHLYTRVDAEKKAGNGAVDIRYRVAEDKPVSLGKIILRGNDRTEDRVITRELLVKEGDVYDYGAILRSQQQIYRLGFFGVARFEPLRPGEQEYVKDMLLTVEERPAGAVEFGAGYGDLDRLRGFVEVSHSNLWGSAKSASIRLEGGDITQQAVLSFREPWFLGQRLEARLRLAWSDAKRLNPDTREVYYQTRKTEVSTGVEKAVDRLKLSLIYQFENVDNSNVQQGAILSQEDEGRVLVSSVTPGLIWDLRDDAFNPRKGSLHGIAVKEALKELGSEAEFTKATFQTSWFLPAGRSTVFALSARAGRAWPRGVTPDGNKAEVPLHERFYLGGGNTVRGYLQDMVGPAKLNPDGTVIPTGGDRMALFNAELRLSQLEGFGVVLFADAGNVWINHSIDLHDIRASYGIGLRYQTPVGPLRIDYGQKINRRGARLVPSAAAEEPPIYVSGESPGELYFNIGHAF